MVSLVCVPYRDKEGRLQADRQDICLMKDLSITICPWGGVSGRSGTVPSYLILHLCLWKPRSTGKPFRRQSLLKVLEVSSMVSLRQQRRKEILSVSVAVRILNLPTRSWLYQERHFETGS